MRKYISVLHTDLLAFTTQPHSTPKNRVIEQIIIMKALKGQQQSGLTGRLVLTLLCATFGTFFAIGFGLCSLNGPQNIVLQWIRDVKCRHFGGIFGTTYSTNDTIQDVVKDLWCKPFPANEEKEMLVENTELNTLWALIASGVSAGAVLSVLICPMFIQRVGVKKTIMVSAGVFAVGCLLCGFCTLADSWAMLLAGRIIMGMGCGFETTVVPIYMAEVTPVRLRGAAGTLPCLLYIFGLILATGLGFPHILGTETGWPILAGFAAVPSIISICILLKCPESPRFLYITRGEKIMAQQALIWLRGSTEVADELDEMAVESANLRNSRKFTVTGLFTDPFLRRAAFLCMVPMLGQQFSGFNCLALYSTSIFAEIGLGNFTSLLATLGLWIGYGVACGLSMVLVDRLGRRILLSASSIGVILALAMYVTFVSVGENGLMEWTKFASAVCLPVVIFSFGMGSASIPWILSGELFTQEARGAAAIFVSAVSWICATLVSALFPVIVVVMSQYTFLIFVAAVALATVHIIWKLPETKGLTVESIQKKLASGQI